MPSKYINHNFHSKFIRLLHFFYIQILYIFFRFNVFTYNNKQLLTLSKEFCYDPLSIWLPVVEKDFGQERFLPTDPITAIKEGKIHSVPFIVSQTTDEFFWKAFSKYHFKYFCFLFSRFLLNAVTNRRKEFISFTHSPTTTRQTQVTNQSMATGVEPPLNQNVLNIGGVS